MSTMADDLERKAVTELQGFLDREGQLWSLMLTPVQIADILCTLAVGTTATAAATIANMGKPEASPEQLFDTVLARIVMRVRTCREEAVTRVREQRKQRGEA